MLSLATRLRPNRLVDIVGQDFTVRVLSQALKSNALPQACLFGGAAGVGKTTLARVLARSLVCESDDPDECLSCANCKAFLELNHPDIFEFDAGTNTGVDDIRSCLESANYRPQLAKCKIFIIDETHMLSKSAISALLKIIEDTPDNTWFFFATTELDKIPYTIISRCLLFKLDNISSADMVKYLQKVCDKLGFIPQIEALNVIEEAASGCVRAALALLEQIALADQNQITYLTALQSTKLLSNQDLEELYNAVNNGDKELIFKLTSIFVDKANPYFIAKGLLKLAHVKKDMEIGLQMGYALEELSYSPLPEKLLAMLLVKACTLKALPSEQALWLAYERCVKNDVKAENPTEDRAQNKQANMDNLTEDGAQKKYVNMDNVDAPEAVQVEGKVGATVHSELLNQAKKLFNI